MARGERGSALLISLVLVAIITLLGAAMFYLATVESRAMLVSEVDYKAFELAQAGIQRMLYHLYRDLCGSASCSSPPPSPSWADGSIDGVTPSPALTQTEYRTFTPTSGTSELSSAVLGEVTGVGQYTLQLRLISRDGLASQFGVTCKAPAAASSCEDAILIRSTGHYAVGGITTSRTLEVLARAMETSSSTVGITTGGASAGSAITGNIRIAGSVHIIGCAEPPCAELSDPPLGGNSRIQNSYFDMPNEIQRRIPRLPKVCLPSNLGCNPATAGVESLGAEVRIAAPILSPAISLSGSASVGQDHNDSSAQCRGLGLGFCRHQYDDGSGSVWVNSKANVDGMYVADGCQNTNCTDSYGGSAGIDRVYSDNGATNPYDINPVPPLPRLSGRPFSIGGNTYANFSCDGAATCSGNDFFALHAPDVFSDLPLNGFTSDGGIDVGSSVNCGSNTCDFNRQVRWFNPFDHPGQTVPPASSEIRGCMAFRRTGSKQGLLAFYRVTDPAQLDTVCPETLSGTGNPLPTGAIVVLTDHTLPMLVRIDGSFRIQSNVEYRGAAMFVVRGATGDCPGSACWPNSVANNPREHKGVLIEGEFGPPACSPPCPKPDDQIFPRQHVVHIATPSGMVLGTPGGSPGLFGYFHAGGRWRGLGQSHVVGSATAQSFKLDQVASFWQIPAATPLFPAPVQKFRIRTSHWRQCRPDPAISVLKCPTYPSG